MNTQVIPFGGSTALAVPSYFADIFGGETNIPPKLSVPQLSVKGGKFRVLLEGEETVMTRVNPDTNEPEPVSVLKVVVLNMGKRAARSFYTKKYNPDNVVPPDCFSLDGEKPDSSVKEPQCATCAVCPQSQKGSKISEASGKAITACTIQRRLVVVPAAKLDFEPLLLRLAPTSAWDKNNDANEGQGWYAWQQYLDFIASRGVQHTAQIVTMVKFDTATEYPKLLFKTDRWLEQNEAMQVKDVWNSEKVRKLLEAKEHDAIGSVSGDEVPFETPTPAPAAVTPPAASAAPAAAPSKPKAAKPAEAPAPVAEAAPASAAEVRVEPVGSKLSSLLDSWGA